MLMMMNGPRFLRAFSYDQTGGALNARRQGDAAETWDTRQIVHPASHMATERTAMARPHVAIPSRTWTCSHKGSQRNT